MLCIKCGGSAYKDFAWNCDHVMFGEDLPEPEYIGQVRMLEWVEYKEVGKDSFTSLRHGEMIWEACGHDLGSVRHPTREGAIAAWKEKYRWGQFIDALFKTLVAWSHEGALTVELRETPGPDEVFANTAEPHKEPLGLKASGRFRIGDMVVIAGLHGLGPGRIRKLSKSRAGIELVDIDRKAGGADGLFWESISLIEFYTEPEKKPFKIGDRVIDRYHLSRGPATIEQKAAPNNPGWHIRYDRFKSQGLCLKLDWELEHYEEPDTVGDLRKSAKSAEFGSVVQGYFSGHPRRVGLLDTLGDPALEEGMEITGHCDSILDVPLKGFVPGEMATLSSPNRNGDCFPSPFGISRLRKLAELHVVKEAHNKIERHFTRLHVQGGSTDLFRVEKETKYETAKYTNEEIHQLVYKSGRAHKEEP